MTNAFHRRTFLGAAAAATAAATLPVAARAECARAPSLGAAAAERGLTFGCSIGVAVLPDKPYVDLLLREARILTTDLAFKLPFIHPERHTHGVSMKKRA